MKRKITIFSFLVATSLLTACSGNPATVPGTTDSITGNYVPTNPYRDTFATTSTYGNATTIDNSGSGGAGIAKAHPTASSTVPATPAAPVAKPDTAKTAAPVATK